MMTYAEDTNVETDWPYDDNNTPFKGWIRAELKNQLWMAPRVAKPLFCLKNISEQVLLLLAYKSFPVLPNLFTQQSVLSGDSMDRLTGLHTTAWPLTAGGRADGGRFGQARWYLSRPATEQRCKKLGNTNKTNPFFTKDDLSQKGVIPFFKWS